MTIDWISHDRYDDAISASIEQDKPILIYFHSRSCSGCSKLAAEVWTDPVVQQAVARQAIAVWVEVESGRADQRVSALVGSHIFIMSPVVQLISPEGNIFHKFLGAPLHTRLDLGYTRVHHDISGELTAHKMLSQLSVGLGKRLFSNGKFAHATHQLSDLPADPADALAAQEAAYWRNVALDAGHYAEDRAPHTDLPEFTSIANAVRRFCCVICRIPDAQLMVDWPGQRGDGGWAHYTDCLREVCLGVYQTLLDAGNAATAQRTASGRQLSAAQLILRDWHIAYRSLHGTLQGLRLQDWDRQHMFENYTLGKQRTIRNNIVHCVMAEFWAHGSAIRRTREVYAGARNDGSIPVHATWKQYGPPPPNFGLRSALFQLWETRHMALVREFSDISDKELDFQLNWWESSPVSIRFRLNRLGWHLQDHAAVVETICERMGRHRTETERLAARIFTALGNAEGAMIGLPDTETSALFAPLAAALHAKSDEMEALYAHCWQDAGTTVPTRARADAIAWARSHRHERP